MAASHIFCIYVLVRHRWLGASLHASQPENRGVTASSKQTFLFFPYDRNLVVVRNLEDEESGNIVPCFTQATALKKDDAAAATAATMLNREAPPLPSPQASSQTERAPFHGGADALAAGGQQHRQQLSQCSVHSVQSKVEVCMEELQDTCAICLAEFELNDPACLLPCAHLFHTPCLESWIGSHSTCPFCKLDLNISKKREGASTSSAVGRLWRRISGRQRRSDTLISSSSSLQGGVTGSENGLDVPAYVA
jgi:hypothetical protein